MLQIRSVVCLTAAVAIAISGCLYKSGGKYVGTFDVSRVQILPAEPTANDSVSVSLTVHFTGTTTAASPIAKVRVTVDAHEPLTLTVPLTPQSVAAGAGSAVGSATVEIGKLAPGEHAIAAVVAAPPGLAGAVQTPLVRTVMVR